MCLFLVVLDIRNTKRWSLWTETCCKNPLYINNKNLLVVIDGFLLYICYYTSFKFPIIINISMAEEGIFVVGKTLAKLWFGL
jgi:hypothetical protein